VLKAGKEGAGMATRTNHTPCPPIPSQSTLKMSLSVPIPSLSFISPEDMSP